MVDGTEEGGEIEGFWKFFDKLSDAMAGLAGVILVFITAAVCYTIGMRYLFTKTTIWIMQTTEYALLWIVFLATTWLLKQAGRQVIDLPGPEKEKFLKVAHDEGWKGTR